MSKENPDAGLAPWILKYFNYCGGWDNSERSNNTTPTETYSIYQRSFSCTCQLLLIISDVILQERNAPDLYVSHGLVQKEKLSWLTVLNGLSIGCIVEHQTIMEWPVKWVTTVYIKGESVQRKCLSVFVELAVRQLRWLIIMEKVECRWHLDIYFFGKLTKI